MAEQKSKQEIRITGFETWADIGEPVSVELVVPHNLVIVCRDSGEFTRAWLDGRHLTPEYPPMSADAQRQWRVIGDALFDACVRIGLMGAETRADALVVMPTLPDPDVACDCGQHDCGIVDCCECGRTAAECRTREADEETSYCVTCEEN
jgi:hypothetical protein